MSRTPLFGVLRRIAREQVLTERRERGKIGRRAFLGGTAGLAVASTLPAVGLAATATIAVVGAGLAGLTAAYRLRKAGYKADLFEGSSRIGGRCYTARGVFGDGQVAEHGGEFIDSGHMEIRALAKELGLALDDVTEAVPKNTQSLFSFNGKPYNLADATRDWQPLFPILQKQAKSVGDFSYKGATPEARRLDSMTVSDWIATYVPGGAGGQLGQLIDTAFCEENGADADRQSALALISALSANRRDRFDLYNAESDQRFHVRGGNDQIAYRLAAGLGADVLAAMPLVAISRLDDGRYRLSFRRDGGIVDRIYDRVILAIPFSVMRTSVDFRRAGFRPLKNEAIETMPMGANTKFQMQFTRRAWNDVGCDGEMRMASRVFQTTWDVSRAQAGQSGILNFFSGGTRALDAGKIDAVSLATIVMKDAAAITPNLSALWTGLMIKDAWSGNPWSLGSYSYFSPGYQTRVVGIEAEPEGNCFFAGEHTAPLNAFLNSAVESGMRASAEVAASLR